MLPLWHLQDKWVVLITQESRQLGGGVATPVLLSSKSGINWACAKPSITVPRYHAVSSRIRREGVQWQMT